MKKLTILIVVVLVLGLTGIAYAEDAAADTTNAVGGTVAYCVQWTFAAAKANPDMSTALSTIDCDDYDADQFTVEDIIICDNLDANDSLDVQAKISAAGWTTPALYTGPKDTISTDSDFKIKCTDKSDNLAYAGDYGSQFTLINNAYQTIISSAQAAGNGIEDQSFHIDAQFPWDWVNDEAGAYEVTISLQDTQVAE